MSAWSECRQLASQRHAELVGAAAGLVPAAELLTAAEKTAGLKRVACPRGDPLLDGAEAAYDHDRKRIYYAKELDEATANFYVAHEFAHHWLDEVATCCKAAELDCASPAEPAMSPVGDSDSYSPKERAEALANVYARELLLPREKLRRLCAGEAVTAEALAVELAVPVDLVMQQMADALLLPVEREREKVRDREDAPDASQTEAITAEPGPRQVRAGPGSGKTRTLVGRIAHLITRGEAPSSILALTYSNLSAQDLTSRIRREIGDKATAVWAGTFHAYGLELLRKNCAAIGMASPPKLLDRTDCLMLLEELLPELDLDHYLDLREPILKLRYVLNAIGRAKDELATPDDYQRYGQAMMVKAAGEPKACEAAAKVLEVARVYARYEKELRLRGAVDFGDLVVLPVLLLRGSDKIRGEVRAEHRHVLVDEYQDMNRASGMLLQQIATPELGPWVVGDVRQAIYRFRGASPLNMSRFKDDFPGAKSTDLSVNYRSGGKIVRAFETFGQRMTAAKLATAGELTAHRGEGTGTVVYEIATSRESEFEGIASSILKRSRANTPFGDQAVLARSHTILTRLARHLERVNVPCLYFGDFFERPEVRDLLAFLSLIAEPRGVGLFRVAQFPQYAVPPEDVCILTAWRRTLAPVPPMLAALRRLGEVPNLSAAGRIGLGRLADDVAFVTFPMTPHRALLNYLFARPGHLANLLANASVLGQQRRLAVYQLLQFAFAYKPTAGGDPKRAFLDHVRRLELLDEEKQLRQMPAAAKDINAVKLMTVHASKGLEFPIVHIPTLTTRHFPAPARHDWCPPPEGMIGADDLMSKEAEEDSLFFVAMSRARDELVLSRPLMAGKQSTKNPSRFLKPIERHLPKKLDGAAAWIADGSPEPPHPILAGGSVKAEWSTREIETYVDCPRRYYYEYELNLTGPEEDTPYLRFHSALRASIGWLRETKTDEARKAGIDKRFKDDWSQHGPAGEPFDQYYHGVARKMIDKVMMILDGECLEPERTATLPGTGAVVKCRADHIQSTANGVVIRRLKAGRLSKKETEKARYVLLQEAVSKDYAGSAVAFEHVSLLDGVSRTTTLDPAELRTELTVLDDVVRNIGAGKFDPKPSDWCPTCPYYLVCPSHGATR
jgi:superfamily I DNA/RNA helicase